MPLPATISTTPAWADATAARLGPFQNSGDLFAFGIDKTNNRVRAYRSQDLGLTWAEVDSGTTRSTSTTSQHKTADAVQSGTTVYLAVPTSTSALSVYAFALGSAAWTTTVAGPTITLGTTGGVFRVALTAFTSGGTDYLVLLYEGASETVMGTAYSRIKAHVRNMTAGTWAGPYDVVGSANTPPANTLPGTQTNYTTPVAQGVGDRALLFWLEGANLRCRQWTASQFATTITPATDAAAQGPGAPCTYVRGSTTGAAVLYPTSAAFKVARVDDATGAATVGNWTTQTALALTPTTTSLTGIGGLVADGERVWAFGVTGSNEVWYADDAGGGGWREPTGWKRGPETVCTGLSPAKLTDALGVLYHDRLGDAVLTQTQVDATLQVGHQSASPSWRAQAFRFADAKTLKAVRLWVGKTGSPTVPGSLMCEIRADVSGLPHGSSNLGNFGFSHGHVSAAGAWLSFPFTTAIALTANTTYWLVVKGSSVAFDASNHYWVGYATSDVYGTYGMAYGNQSSNVTWTGQSAGTGDLAFLLYTTEDSPERLRYDRVVVLGPLGSRSVGTEYSAEVDLGAPGQEGVVVTVTSGTSTDPTGTIEATLESRWNPEETWVPVTTTVFEACQGHDTIPVPKELCGRWLRVKYVTTTAASPSGAAAVEPESEAA